MLPFSINTFWSLTQALSTFRKVWVARWTAMLTASSKLSSDVALISVTRATVIEESPFFVPLSLSRVSYPLSRQTSPLNVRRIGGVTMAENHVSMRPSLAGKPHRYKVDEGLVVRFLCHANSTHVLQTLVLAGF